MIRKLMGLMMGLAVIGMIAIADEKKEEPKKISVEGKLVCTKCELKETKKCGHAILVKDKDDAKKEIKYYIKDKGGAEPYHKECCTAPVDAKVSGKLVEKKEKDKVTKTIEEPKVEVKK
jgi:hypothetical protein